VLAGHLERRLGLVVDLTRGVVVGNQRFLAVVLALVKSSRILGGLQFGLLLSVGRLSELIWMRALASRASAWSTAIW
jgi:hypothetical protein